MENPIEFMNGIEREAKDALLSAFNKGGNKEDWVYAKSVISTLKKRCVRFNAKATARYMCQIMGQVDSCIKSPETEMKRLMANGFGDIEHNLNMVAKK